jgi:hypothetical protein
VILFFVSRTQPEKIKYEDPIVQDVLMRDLRERKLNVAMAQRFDALQQSAHIVNYLDPSASHAPKRRAGAASAGQDSGARNAGRATRTGGIKE